jgi:signal transduction histidine kinase
MDGARGQLATLVKRFEMAADALERSYHDLQQRVETLTAELQKEREERIRLERVAGMGEMAMELAHEIRNPLGSIELYASMLEGEYAQQIVQSVRLLNHSVTNVLQFGKPIMPSPAAMSVKHLLDGIRVFLDPVARQKRIQIVTDCANDCIVAADHELLHRMLLNLVLNALREIPAEGRIRLRAWLRASEVVIEVEDTGPGINDEQILRIFDPMFSTTREGCGLGLPIVKRIVDTHNGTIAVRSSRTGTQFLISIPHNMEVVREQAACS